MKRISFVTLTALWLLSIVGCSPQIETMATEIHNKSFENLNLVSKQLIPNCGASFGLPCQQPLYTISFSADSNESAKDICVSVIEFQAELGLDAYAAEGAAEIGVVDDVGQVISFCEEGLSQGLETSDASIYYEGTVLFEDGSEDGLGKTTVISRRSDGSYFVEFSIGRDKGRIGWFEIQGEPAHRDT